MKNYSIVPEVGQAIVKLLRDYLVPDPVRNNDEIGLCSPGNKGNLSVSVSLYDIQKSEEVFSNSMQNAGIHSQKYPSEFVELHYMITAYSESDTKFRAEQEQNILGCILQILLEQKSSLHNYINNTFDSEYPLQVQFEKLPVDEKMKIYSVPSESYKLSLFFRVYPVEIKSTRRKRVQRVGDADFSAKEL